MPSLHIVNKAPDHARFQTCLAAVADEDTLLLTENAVLAAVMAQGLPGTVFALSADLEARGLAPADIMANIGRIDFAGFVSLTEATSRIISW
ncbi:MAG: sulfurtransferase complex subunit TusB [Oleiphilaceae bacterium]|nr:sulfurtransferase complex subunit TusB [Oleiphilaceae bacterium]